MRLGILGGIGSALAWFVFPLMPALLGTSYLRALNSWFGSRGGPDPREWEVLAWVILTGPLLGYGFLAGLTLDLPDGPGRRGPRDWPSRRSLWVAIGPWVGSLAWGLVYLVILFTSWIYPPSREWSPPSFPAGRLGQIGRLVVESLLIGSLAYGWLFVARAGLRRAGRLGRLRASTARALGVTVGFVGSLFGSFWAITEAWRGYFFDPRILPVLLGASTLVLMAGCAGTETYGEVRRRELFEAMLVSWLLGLALAWRWWGRPRPKPPRAS